jgi:hypothetical protein
MFWQPPKHSNDEHLHEPPPARVFLFAKVSPPCPHGSAPAGACDAVGTDMPLDRVAGAADARVGTRRRTRRSRRGGTAPPVPQPCTWAGDERS